MSIQEKFAENVGLFKRAIRDQIKAKHGETYVANTGNLKAAAFAAFKELADSDDSMTPMMAVAVWEAVMHVNDSAFHQELERDEKAGTLGFKVVRAKRTPASAALSYLQ
jgi:hypothetical protein